MVEDHTIQELCDRVVQDHGKALYERRRWNNSGISQRG